MKNILEIKVAEDLRWSVVTNGKIEDIVESSSDCIASLIQTLSKDSDKPLTPIDFYCEISKRVITKLTEKK